MTAWMLMVLLQQDAPPPRPPRVQPPPGPDMPLRPVQNPEEVKAWLREHEPETARRVDRATKEGRRPEAMQMLADAERRMRESSELKERDPKAFAQLQELRKLERESLELADQARQPGEREAVSAKLKETLSKLFDLREESKARELAELRKRVDEIEKQIEARKKSKERIVERRRRELLGERMEDDW